MFVCFDFVSCFFFPFFLFVWEGGAGGGGVLQTKTHTQKHTQKHQKQQEKDGGSHRSQAAPAAPRAGWRRWTPPALPAWRRPCGRVDPLLPDQWGRLLRWTDGLVDLKGNQGETKWKPKGSLRETETKPRGNQREIKGKSKGNY